MQRKILELINPHDNSDLIEMLSKAKEETNYNTRDHFDFEENEYSTQTFDGLIERPYDYIAKPTLSGMKLLASYYEHKLNVSIIVIESLDHMLDEMIKLRETHSETKIGFIMKFLCHTISFIYEKNGANECLYQFDSMGLKSPIFDNIFSVIKERRSQFAQLQIYCSIEIRQTDYHSCCNDAFFILKEAFKIDIPTSIRNAEKKTIFSDDERITYFTCNVPERCLKSAQSRKTMDIVSSTSRINEVVKGNGETLESHRKRYTVKVNVSRKYSYNADKKEKDVNLYLLKYGYKNMWRAANEHLRQSKVKNDQVPSVNQVNKSGNAT